MCSSSVMQVCKKKIIPKWKKITSMHVKLPVIKCKLEIPIKAQDKP